MKTGTYKKGLQTRDKILKIAAEMFYEQGCSNVSLSDISRRAEIAIGNLTYYFKNKSDIIHTLIMQLLERCDETAHELLTEYPEPHYTACMGTFLLMLTVCSDPQIGRFVNEVYEDLDSRFLISIYLERYYSGYFHMSEGKTVLSENQVHALIVADAHAKFGILRDLLERTAYKPTLESILEMSETDYLLTSRLCGLEDALALNAIRDCKVILEKRGYLGVPLSVGDLGENGIGK